MGQIQPGELLMNKTTGNVLKFGGEVVHNVHIDKEYQMFWNETGHYIYHKDLEEVYKMQPSYWEKLLLKIEAVKNDSCIVGPVLEYD